MIRLAHFLLLLSFSLCIHAQYEVVKLWDKHPTRKEKRPELRVFAPVDSLRNGTCVLICPGGSYHHLGLRNEGSEVAEYLRQWGITAASVLAGTALVYGLLYYIDVARGVPIEQGKIALDSTVMVLNITGQVLLSLAFADSWFIWILVNIFSVALWTNRAIASGSGSYAPVMIAKYVFFFFNSLNGLRLWLKFDRQQRQ